MSFTGVGPTLRDSTRPGCIPIVIGGAPTVRWAQNVYPFGSGDRMRILEEGNPIELCDRSAGVGRVGILYSPEPLDVRYLALEPGEMAADRLDVDRRRAMIGAAIWIDPARRDGTPCLNGTGLTCQWVAERLAVDGAESTLTDISYIDHGITRRDVLVAAAWWVNRGWHIDPPEYDIACDLLDEWADWARGALVDAWGTIDPVELSDPPALDHYPEATK